MYQREETIIHIYPKDLKPTSDSSMFLHWGPIKVKVIWIHADIKLPDFYALQIWTALIPLLDPDDEYVIITEMQDSMQMSLKNIQFRH